MDAMNLNWVKSYRGIRFDCLKDCASCCKRSEGVSLTPKDHQRILNHTGNTDFADPIDHPVFSHRLKAEESKCIFLAGTNLCTLYPLRPVLCRLYPFQLHFKWDGRILWCLEHCPGVSRPEPSWLDEPDMENLFTQILELEGEEFYDKLSAYVKQVKEPVTPIFNDSSSLIFGSWASKERLVGILWEMFNIEPLQALTPRGRLECIRCDILPRFHHHFVKEALRAPRPRVFYMGEDRLREGYVQFEKLIHQLAKESAEAEHLHQMNLQEKGNLLYNSLKGEKACLSRNSRVRIHRLNGEGVDVEIDRLMFSLPVTFEALKEEEEYLRELSKREGRYGKEVSDLPFDSEVRFLFLVADALELKASAFAAHSGKNCVGIEEMRESIWVAERTLVRFLEEIVGPF